jgi:hypothetical protein
MSPTRSSSTSEKPLCQLRGLVTLLGSSANGFFADYEFCQNLGQMS